MDVIAQLTRFVLHWRGPVLAVLLATMLVAGVGIREVQVDFALEDLYGGDRAAVAELAEHVAFWGDDASTVVIVAEARDGTVLTAERLGALHALSETLSQDPGVAGVDSIVSVKRLVRPAVGVAVPAPLWKTRPSDPRRAQQWVAGMLRDPALVPLLISADGARALLSVRLTEEVGPIERLRPVVERIEREVATRSGTAGLTYGAGGMAVIRASILDMVVTEQLTFVPVSVGVILLFVIVMFRSVHGLVVPLLAVGIPTVWLLGIMGATGESIGLINQVCLTLVPAIAVADAIHLVYRYHEELRERVGPLVVPTPEVRVDAIVAAARHVGAACLATSVTTAVGFLSLITAKMPVLSGFGTYAALGVMLAYASFLLALPIGLYVTGGSAPHAATGRSWIDRVLDAAVVVATRHLWPVLLGTAVVTAVFATASSWVDVEYRLSDLVHPDAPGAQVNHQVDAHLGGLISMDIALRGAPETLTSPAFIRDIDALTDALGDVSEVRVVTSASSLLRAVSRQAGGDGALPEASAIRPLLDAARQRGIMSQVLADDASRARLIVRTRDVGLQSFVQIAPEVERLAAQHFADHEVEWSLVGSSPMVYFGVTEVTADLRRSLVVAFLVVTGVVFLVFGSLRVALWSLPPNIVPLVVGYGTMGLVGWPLEPAPAMIFTMALGIAIDATIHLIARFREERSRLGDWQPAIRRAIHGSGRAIAITTVIVAFALGMNTTSAFQANRVMGAVGAIVLVTALISALTFLAATLRFLDEEP